MALSQKRINERYAGLVALWVSQCLDSMVQMPVGRRHVFVRCICVWSRYFIIDEWFYSKVICMVVLRPRRSSLRS